jgi:hypothetical protein
MLHVDHAAHLADGMHAELRQSDVCAASTEDITSTYKEPIVRMARLAETSGPMVEPHSPSWRTHSS